ncbi:MAG: hypothetical protein ACYSUB_21555 [Planctomycetota bacterium]
MTDNRSKRDSDTLGQPRPGGASDPASYFLFRAGAEARLWISDLPNQWRCAQPICAGWDVKGLICADSEGARLRLSTQTK